MKTFLKVAITTLVTLVTMAIFNALWLGTSGLTIWYLVWALKNETFCLILAEVVTCFGSFAVAGGRVLQALSESWD